MYSNDMFTDVIFRFWTNSGYHSFIRPAKIIQLKKLFCNCIKNSIFYFNKKRTSNIVFKQLF